MGPAWSSWLLRGTQRPRPSTQLPRNEEAPVPFPKAQGLWLTRHRPPSREAHTGPSSSKGAPGHNPGPRQRGFSALGWVPGPHRGSLGPDSPSPWPGGGRPPSPCLQDLHSQVPSPQVPAHRCHPTGASPQVPMGAAWSGGRGLGTHTMGESPVKPTLQQGLGVHWTRCSHLHGPQPLSAKGSGGSLRPLDGAGTGPEQRKGCQLAASTTGLAAPPATPHQGSRVRPHPAPQSGS